MVDPRTLPIAGLIRRCQEHTVHYLRTHELGEDCYCLELFRRAVQEHDERAWAFIYTFYSTEDFLGDHYLLKWVRSWLRGRHGPAIRAAYTEEEIVQEVWLRFMHSEAARTFNFATMSHVMAYLRRLVNNFALDAARRRAPTLVEASTEQDAAGLDLRLRAVPDSHGAMDEAVTHAEAMSTLLEDIVRNVVTNEHERLVFNGYFLEGLPPRRLYALHPGVFAAGEIETTRTRLVRRLRRSPFLLERYVKNVILNDDERLSLVFQHTFVESLPDDELLARFPSLFDSASDLLAAKVRVLEAVRNRPALLQLLAGGA